MKAFAILPIELMVQHCFGLNDDSIIKDAFLLNNAQSVWQIKTGTARMR